MDRVEISLPIPQAVLQALERTNRTFVQPSLSSLPDLENGRSYENWRRAHYQYLHSAGLLRYIEEEVPEPEDETSKVLWAWDRGRAYNHLFDYTRLAKVYLQMATRHGYDNDPDRNPYKLWKAAEETFAQFATRPLPRIEKDETMIARARTLQNVPWCDDYKRMISGILYNAQAPELVHGRFRARRLMHKYNTHFPDDATTESLAAYRMAVLRETFGHVGGKVDIEAPLHVDYGCNISIGDGFRSGFNLVIVDCGMVNIGSRVMCGNNVSIITDSHETGVQSRRDGIEYAKAVRIGDDCLIRDGVCVMPGVSIGKGCLIGAGSVVARDIPEFSVAAGSPARVVKKVEEVWDL